LIKIAQDEAERYRLENELLQRTLSDQEAASRREIEELQQYAKVSQGNSERQMREFKAQLQMKSKEIMNMRQELNEATL
jgi:hypothetical protein